MSSTRACFDSRQRTVLLPVDRDEHACFDAVIRRTRDENDRRGNGGAPYIQSRILATTHPARLRPGCVTECMRYHRSDRTAIKEKWIVAAIANPLLREKQRDGRIRYWIWVEDAQKYLRVILLEHEETVHNAFFDRGFRKENAP